MLASQAQAQNLFRDLSSCIPCAGESNTARTVVQGHNKPSMRALRTWSRGLACGTSSEERIAASSFVKGIYPVYLVFGDNVHIDALSRYYEWQTKGKDKLPHFTRHSGDRLMLMAGLYEYTEEKGRGICLRFQHAHTERIQVIPIRSIRLRLLLQMRARP